MKKRWLPKLGLLACLGLLGLVVVLWWTAPNHRIDRRSADQIKTGMTFEEVVRIIGEAPGDYTTAALSQEGAELRFLMKLNFGVNHIRLTKEPTFRYWYCDSGGIEIGFDDDEKVTSKRFQAFPGTLLDKLRGLLRIR